MQQESLHTVARLFRHLTHENGRAANGQLRRAAYGAPHMRTACSGVLQSFWTHSFSSQASQRLILSHLPRTGRHYAAQLLHIQMRHMSIAGQGTMAQGAQQVAATWGTRASQVWKKLQEASLIDPFSGFARDFLRPVMVSCKCSGSHVQRLLPDMMVEFLRKDKLARVLPGPSVYDHRLTAVEVKRSAAVQAFQTAVQAVSNLLRLLFLTLLFSPVVLTASLALQHHVCRPLWLFMFRKTLEVAGPAFIKWGQWAATRADVFPPDFCHELAHLQSAAPAHAYKHTEAAVATSLGAPVEDLFMSFNREPLASGSIGQVHLARLSQQGASHTGLPAGTQVAVKVRHPGVGRAISRDFALMVGVARVAELLPAMRRLRLQDSLKQFAAPLREQVDLALEGRLLWQFNYNFRTHPHIRFPYPLYPLVAPEVLVETFEQGESITKYVGLGPDAPHNNKLAVLGSYALLQMLLVDNLVHADLHPGNILVHLDAPRGTRSLYQRFANLVGLKTPEVWSAPTIILLDVGMSTQLTEHERQRMVDLFRSFSRLDGAAMARTTLTFSPEQSCSDPQGFIRDCDAMFARMRQQHSEAGGPANTDGAEAMAATLEIIREHEVSLPGQVCAILVSVLVLEGWSSQLSPQHSVLNQVERLVSSEEGSQNQLDYLLKTILWDIVTSPTPLDVKLASPS